MNIITGRTALAVLSLFALFTLAACGTRKGYFRIAGRLANLNRGEFYIYNADDGTNGIDTITVNDGRFFYETPLNDKATFIIVFPNFSEQAVFAESGKTVTIKGDASHLKEMQIEGTDDNKLMTGFRQNLNRLSPPEIPAEVTRFINEHADSPVSLYLLKRYFIQTGTPDYRKAASLLATMLKATPDNGRLLVLKAQVDKLRNAATGTAVPAFQTTGLNGQTASLTTMKAKVNVAYSWATWSYDSQNIQRALENLRKQHPADIKLLGICLDADVNACRQTVQRDSVRGVTVCDRQMWNTPLLSTFGIGTVPGNVIFNAAGKVVARNLNYQQLTDKIESML